MLGDVLLGIVTLCTLLSYLPQAIKLIKTKKFNDLSAISWIIWVVSSFSYTLYAFLCSNEFMLRVETTLEFSFCLIILILIQLMYLSIRIILNRCLPILD